MNVVKRGDKYHPKVGEPFIIMFRGKRHLVRMGDSDRCGGCPLDVLKDGPFEERCHQYIACRDYPLNKHIVSAEEDIE